MPGMNAGHQKKLPKMTTFLVVSLTVWGVWLGEMEKEINFTRNWEDCFRHDLETNRKIPLKLLHIVGTVFFLIALPWLKTSFCMKSGGIFHRNGGSEFYFFLFFSWNKFMSMDLLLLFYVHAGCPKDFSLEMLLEEVFKFPILLSFFAVRWLL